MTATRETVNPTQLPAEDKSVLRWGGLAGTAGGVLFLLIFAMVMIFAGPGPTGPEQAIAHFPGIRAVRTTENSLYLLALALWAPLSVALYRRLRRTRPAPALFGATLNLLGLGVLAAGALPHLVTAGLSDRYHNPATTASDQATLVLLWQATQGLFDALLIAGLVLMSLGIILLGVAARHDPAMGTRIGTASILLGVTGLAAAAAVLADPASSLAAVGIFALIAFHLLLGWKTHRLSAAA